jgi:16S rRNA processing protein RimM
MNNNGKILVGKIVAFQGVRGDVRVQTYTATPSDLRDMTIISDKFKSDDFRFIRALPNTNVIIAHIRGFEDRTSAEVLRGTELFINRDSLPDVKDGEYYQADLIGFDVFRDGKKLGTVDGFQNFGAGDIIELSNGEMVSFVRSTTDINNKKITVK